MLKLREPPGNGSMCTCNNSTSAIGSNSQPHPRAPPQISAGHASTWPSHACGISAAVARPAAGPWWPPSKCTNPAQAPEAPLKLFVMLGHVSPLFSACCFRAEVLPALSCAPLCAATKNSCQPVATEVVLISSTATVMANAPNPVCGTISNGRKRSRDPPICAEDELKQAAPFFLPDRLIQHPAHHLSLGYS